MTVILMYTVMTPYFERSLILDTNSVFEIKSLKINIFKFFLSISRKKPKES